MADALVLVGRPLLLQGLVDDKVDYGLADAPVRRGHALPKPENTLGKREVSTVVTIKIQFRGLTSLE